MQSPFPKKTSTLNISTYASHTTHHICFTCITYMYVIYYMFVQHMYCIYSRVTPCFYSACTMLCPFSKHRPGSAPQGRWHRRHRSWHPALLRRRPQQEKRARQPFTTVEDTATLQQLDGGRKSSVSFFIHVIFIDYFFFFKENSN